MERCPTCGAAVRPDAKFCTSCGSRLEETPAEASQDTQEIIVATPTASGSEDITPEPNWEAASGGVVADETDGQTSDMRQESGETGEQPDHETPVSTVTDPEATWSARWPEPRTADTTTGEDDSGESHARWSWGAPVENAASSWSTDTDEVATESETITPKTDADADTDEEATVPAATDHDPRQHASELLDELRGLIWQINTDRQPGADEKNAIQTISRVRGETSDFADLDPVIAAVRDNPRDIDALRDLGQKADRLQALLDSHKRLVHTLEDAISDQ